MKFKVRVLRTAIGEIEVEVEAPNKIQAMAMAVDAAKNSEISTSRSEYDVVGVYPQEDKC